jgi:hypothetical protein
MGGPVCLSSVCIQGHLKAVLYGQARGVVETTFIGFKDLLAHFEALLLGVGRGTKTIEPITAEVCQRFVRPPEGSCLPLPDPIAERTPRGLGGRIPGLVEERVRRL